MKIRSQLLNRMLARLACGLATLLLKTCRVKVEELAPRTSPYTPNQPERYLYCLWHDMILLHTFAGRHYDLSAIVSRHRDGGYLADAMRAIGVHPVRGSSSKGGAAAVKEVIAQLDGWHVAITPDGPRGPRHKIKPGILWLAAKTGRAIVPTVGVCNNAWHVKGSWTTLTVPKPFSKVLMFGGRKIYLPRDLSREDLSHYAALLETEMAELIALADRRVRGQMTDAEFEDRTAADAIRTAMELSAREERSQAA